MKEPKTEKITHAEALVAFIVGIMFVSAVSLQFIRNSIHQKQKIDEKIKLSPKTDEKDSKFENSSQKKAQTVVKRGVSLGKLMINTKENIRN